MDDFIRQIDNRFTEKEFWRLKKQQLRNNPIPLWLRQAEHEPQSFMNTDFLSLDFLNNSLFYACAYNDPCPIKHWSGFVHSFLYFDRWYDQECFQRQIRPWNLRGYDCFFNAEKTLLDSGQVLLIQDEIARKLEGRVIELIHSYIARKASRREIRELLANEIPPSGDFTAYLYLFRKLPYADIEGPRLLSLCLLKAGSATAYYHLFVKNEVVPRCLSTFNPGMADVIRLNHQKGIFYRILKLNRAGLSPYYMYKSAFPEYSVAVYDQPNPNPRVPSIWTIKDRPRASRSGLFP